MLSAFRSLCPVISQPPCGEGAVRILTLQTEKWKYLEGIYLFQATELEDTEARFKRRPTWVQNLLCTQCSCPCRGLRPSALLDNPAF